MKNQLWLFNFVQFCSGVYIDWAQNERSQDVLITSKLLANIAPLAHISSLTFPSSDVPMAGNAKDPKFSCLVSYATWSVGDLGS